MSVELRRLRDGAHSVLTSGTLTAAAAEGDYVAESRSSVSIPLSLLPGHSPRGGAHSTCFFTLALTFLTHLRPQRLMELGSFRASTRSIVSTCFVSSDLTLKVLSHQSHCNGPCCVGMDVFQIT
jgi:hypothetical protein